MQVIALQPTWLQHQSRSQIAKTQALTHMPQDPVDLTSKVSLACDTKIVLLWKSLMCGIKLCCTQVIVQKRFPEQKLVHQKSFPCLHHH